MLNSEYSNLKFGMMLLRYPRNTRNDAETYSLVPHRTLSNAKRSNQIKTQVPTTKMRFKDGDVVLLTPERDKLIKLQDNDPTIAELTRRLVTDETKIPFTEIQQPIEALANRNASQWADTLVQHGLSDEQARLVTGAIGRSFSNPGGSKTFFDRPEWSALSLARVWSYTRTRFGNIHWPGSRS